MNKRSSEAAANDQSRSPKFEIDRLEGSRSEPNQAEEKPIEMYIGPHARDFYQQAKAKGGAKSFCRKPTSPERFLPRVDIIVRTYVKHRDNEPTDDLVKARKRTLQKSAQAWRELSKNAELQADVRNAFIDERMFESNSAFSTEKWTSREADLGISFDELPGTINKILGRMSQLGRKPHDSTREFVNELAFAWLYLAGILPTYARGTRGSRVIPKITQAYK